jgi:hypothetical protein
VAHTHEPTKLVDRLRRFLRDDATLNTLISGEESSDAQLMDALEDSVDDWNNTPPPLAHITLETHPSVRLLIRGAAIEILASAGILQSRNRLDYSDGGVTVRVSDKAPDYQAWITRMVNDYERKKLELKKTLNIQLGYGAVPSEYYQDRRADRDT